MVRRKKKNSSIINRAAILPVDEKKYNCIIILILMAIGIYQSCILFGHKIVPISDFPAFIKVAREILAFQVPSSFKRAPVTGILQIAFGKIMAGQYPDLRGGWLLNAVLHPFTLVLIWLLAKKIIGKTAFWFAMLVSMTPWLLYMLREPLAETLLLFFIVLTIYLIFMHSNWAYLVVSVATMVRYETAALILAAFVADMIYRKTKKEKIKAFIYSALASVPLGLWLAGTFFFTDVANSSNYLVVFTKGYSENFSRTNGQRTGILLHSNLIWNVGFRPLFMIDPAASKQAYQSLFFISKLTVFASFVFGVGCGIVKKNWQILVLLIFLVPYFFIHAYYPYPISRFHSISSWIVLLISLYGLKKLWLIIKDKLNVPVPMTVVFQITACIIAVLVMEPLWRYMGKLSEICEAVRYMPFVLCLAITAIVVLTICIYGRRYVFPSIATATVMILVVVSNQFSLAPLLGDGQQDAEFKYLADWFIENTNKQEKMAVYMHSTVAVFAQKYASDFVNFPMADNPQQLVEKLRQQKIKYAVWASREGLSNDHYDYKKLNLDKNIRFLKQTKDVGPYKFVTQIRAKRGYLNIFKVQCENAGKAGQDEKNKP